MTNPRLQRQLALARRYAEQRRPDAASRICEDILRIDPGEPFALSFLARMAAASGDRDRAVALLQRAVAATPEDLTLQRALARAELDAGRADDAVSTRIEILEHPAAAAEDWAELGRLCRDRGDAERAARCFTRAFQLDESLLGARRDRNAPDALRELSQDGDSHLLQYHYECNDALARALSDDDQVALPERWDRFLRRFHRREPLRYADERQQPDYHYYEGLTARPFWPRERFPWLAEVEAATDVIRDEFLAAMASDATFEPYVRNATESAPEAWRAMSDQLVWSSLHLFRGNKPVRENCERCPETAALMGRLPLARAEGHAPEVFFSVLRPGTHIPPHYGVSNTKLAIHLPLIIPDDCAIRVGGETHGWTPGECLLFDDSFLHEAWNRSEELRVVLIFETWNPDLTDIEIRCLRSVIERGEIWNRTTAAMAPADLAAA